MRFSLVAVLALSLMACAGTHTASNDSSGKAKPTLASNADGPAAKGKYFCDYEENTGSHRRQKICRYIDSDTDTIHQTQDDWRDFLHRQDTKPGMNPSSGN
jgi:hypothetical protein